MGYPTIGAEAQITSWGDPTSDVNRIAANTVERTATINMPADTIDSTGYGPTVQAATNTPSLREWSVTVGGLYAPSGTRRHGIAGNVVSGGSDYFQHITGYSVTLTAMVHDITALQNASGWKRYRPGYWSVAWTVNMMLDSEDGPTTPPAPGAALPTLTFTYAESTTLAFAAHVNSVSPGLPVDGVNTLDVSGVASGQVTAAGSTGIFAAGAIMMPDWDSDANGIPDGVELVARSSSGRTYTGQAFLRSLRISLTRESLVEVEVQGQGTDALVIA